MATAARPPETDVARVRRYCQRRVPPHARDQVRLETVVRGSAITIIERRAPWRDDFGPEWSRLKVAQLRYDPGAWTGTVASGRPTACRRRTIRLNCPGIDGGLDGWVMRPPWTVGVHGSRWLRVLRVGCDRG